jgi:hypothetical protein
MLIDSLSDGMSKGVLHALQNNEQNIDLMFAPYGPNSTRGAMKPLSFVSPAALADFLKEKIGVGEDPRKDFLAQLASMRHATMNEVWVSEKKRRQLGL